MLHGWESNSKGQVKLGDTSIMWKKRRNRKRGGIQELWLDENMRRKDGDKEKGT